MICNGVLIAHCAHADHPKAGSVVHTSEKKKIILKDLEPLQYRQEIPEQSIPWKDKGEWCRPWGSGVLVLIHPCSACQS